MASTSNHTDTANLTGRQIGRYMLQRQIGSGGVATVYQAFDQVEGRSVALKILLPTADSNTINRFRREALTAGALRHPNIVRIFQVGTALQGDVAYIAMELVEGESLSDWLARVGRLRPEESCNLLEPIAQALAHAHNAGIVHRDVKPSNILLRPASPGVANSVQLESLDHPVVPLLTDFGVARAMDAPELTSTGRTIGTPAYMAPEQCAGNRVIDGRADVYALGTVLYRCVVGRLPFGGTTTQILHAHVYSPLTIDGETLRQLPPIVVDIMRHSLAKKPEDRYADANEMAVEMADAAGRRRLPAAAIEPTSFAESTATLTLSSLPLTPAGSPEWSTNILVPAMEAPARRQQATGESLVNLQPEGGRPEATEPHRQPSLARRLEEFNWLRFSVFALLAMAGAFFLFVLLMTLPDLLSTLPGSAGSLPPRSDTAQVAPTPLPNAAAVDRDAGVRDGDSTGTIEAPPTSIPAEIDATPTPVSTVVDPTTTLVPPTATAPAVMPVDQNQNTECAYNTHPLLTQYISRLDSSIKTGFGCPTSPVAVMTGWLQRFEYGYMIGLEKAPGTYIYYDISQEWERPVSIWSEGDPPRTGDFPPPNETLYQPQGAFGWLWADRQRRVQLGHATTEAPVSFRALEQKFPGGALVRDLDNGYTYLFLRTRLKL